VLSLTRWEERRFSGGETSLLRPETLDYWRGFDSSVGLERGDLVAEVQPLFDRLTVFDARLPHGVSRVEGERDPRGGRLVLHGWFTEPAPFSEGALTEEEVGEGLAAPLEALYAEISPPAVTGLLAVRLEVGADGTVAALRHLADTLVVDPSQLQRGAEADDARPAVLNAVETHLGGARFAPSGGNSSVTVPFLFD